MSGPQGEAQPEQKPSKTEKTEQTFEKLDWMLRPCSVYNEEYKECKSFKGRFNQYFIYGEYLSCDQWKTDYNNCQKWNWLSDKEAAVAVIESELNRREARLRGHYENDIWTPREKPPADWSKPLPEFMQKRDENTYLNIKSHEMKAELEEEEKEKEKAAKGETSQNDNNELKKRIANLRQKNSSFCSFM